MNSTLVAMACGAVLLLVIVALLVRIGSGKGKTPPAKDATSRHDRLAVREPAKPEVMAGGLQHMALADLLQFLAQGGHSGTLQITSGRRAGAIRLVQGLVIHAEFRRATDLDAMFELLSLQIGDFRFRFETPPAEPVRGREVVDILMLWLARKEDPK